MIDEQFFFYEQIAKVSTTQGKASCSRVRTSFIDFVIDHDRQRSCRTRSRLIIVRADVTRVQRGFHVAAMRMRSHELDFYSRFCSKSPPPPPPPQRLRSPFNGLILSSSLGQKGSPSDRTDSPPRRPCHSWSHPQRKSLCRSGSTMLREWMVFSLFCGWSGLLGLCISILITSLQNRSHTLHCLESLGIPSSTSRKLRNECSRVAHRCSYALFLRRKCTEWTSWSMG